MRTIQKYAHGLSSVYVHMSFKVKYCHQVFNIKEFREACQEIFKQVAEKYDFVILQLGFDANHVHIIIDLCKYSEPQIRKLLKGTSGKKLLEQFPGIKRKYFWGSGLWGKQYYCYSIGSDMDALQNYVGKQKFFIVMQFKDQTSLGSFF